MCSEVKCVTIFENKQSSQSYSTSTASILKFWCSEMKFTTLRTSNEVGINYFFLTLFHIGENNIYGSSTNAVDLRLITFPKEQFSNAE